MSALDDSVARHPRRPWPGVDHLLTRWEMPDGCTRLHVAELPPDALDPSDWSVHCALVDAGIPPTSLKIDAFRVGILYTLEVIRAARPK